MPRDPQGAETPSERYERLAEAFYSETGKMAPGKDVPAEYVGECDPSPSVSARGAQRAADKWNERFVAERLLRAARAALMLSVAALRDIADSDAVHHSGWGAMIHRHADAIAGTCYSRIVAAVRAECAAKVRGECVWASNENGAWETQCGRTWEFIDDGPKENGMKFCHNCGKSVRALEAQP